MSADESRVSAAQQDYLEAIFVLEREKGAARVRDIAASLSVHKSTVSAALRSLKARGLVNYRPYELVSLTPEGRRAAEEVSAHHGIISRFLQDVLRLEPGVADAHACRMEHVLDEPVLRRLVLLARFAGECRRGTRGWIGRFDAYLRAREEKADAG
ncbi:MAG: metal-dependent transcriptional regulator [Lentisphaerae bacterium]|nr:metal-dependent transcriptional regulator [Lentisphaerota bacterium]